MKTYFKYSILAILALTITIGLVFAPAVPIGQDVQAVPFEAQPTAFTRSPVHTGWNPVSTFQAYDGDEYTSTNLRITSTAVTGTVATGIFGAFTAPSFPEPFAVGWVDLKIIYEVPAGQTGDDTYKAEYSTDGATWVELLPAATLANSAFSKAVRPWAQITAMDGEWDWADVAGLRVRFTITKGGTGWDLNKNYFVYEIWATVNPLPLPPAASTAVSVQPPAVGGVTPNLGPMGTGNIFFVDVYVQAVTGLAGYEFTMRYDTSIITFAEAWSYWPWIDSVITPDDTLGLVNVIGTAEPPISDVGFDGNSPMARLYFSVDRSGTTPLTLDPSKIGQPDATPIPHTVYNGFFASPHYLSFTGGIFAGGDPTGTAWHEDYPTFSNTWTVQDWIDNGDDTLSASDQLTIEVGGNIKNVHVDQVTITIHWTFKTTGEGLADPEDPSTIPDPPEFDPTDTRWHQIYPIYCRYFGISGWVDNGDGYFSPSDQFTITYDDDGSVAQAHLEAITTNILVSEKPGGPVPEFPFGVTAMMALVAAMPLVYMWRTKRKVMKK